MESNNYAPQPQPVSFSGSFLSHCLHSSNLPYLSVFWFSTDNLASYFIKKIEPPSHISIYILFPLGAAKSVLPPIKDLPLELYLPHMCSQDLGSYSYLPALSCIFIPSSQLDHICVQINILWWFFSYIGLAKKFVRCYGKIQRPFGQPNKTLSLDPSCSF